MANSFTGNFAGPKAAPYFNCALLELNSLSNGSITLNQNVKGGKLNLRVGSLATPLIQDASCAFPTPTDLTLSDKVLLLEDLQSAVEVCKADLFDQWEILQMGDSAWGDTPAEMTDWLIGYILGSTMAGLEIMIWQGSVANAGEFDGFETLFTAGYVATDIPIGNAVGTPVALTSANIIAEMSRLKVLASDAVKSRGDAEFILSANAYEAYVDALGGFGASGVGANGVAAQGTLWYQGQALTFGGYMVKKANGMSDDTMVFTNVSNLVFGTALLSDTTTVKVKDMEDSDLSENIRFKAKFTAGVQYVCGNDVYTYGVATA
jgi:hypothetical protein